MKKAIQIIVYFFLLLVTQINKAQTVTTAPYCCGTYATGICNQPGPSNAPGNFINDFINNFSTTGGNTNISNLNSGCNGAANNCTRYCSHYLSVSPGQTIVCTISSGNTFSQGFAIWVDWNQNNVFDVPAEYMGGTAGVPAATTPTTITFVIPTGQPTGLYTMRVRCSFATAGSGITPCGGATFGETEDYTIYVGNPPSSTVPTGTALVNTPVCVGAALNFSFSTSYSTALSYTWTGPNSYSSTLANPTILGSGSNASGIYTVLVTNSICPITRTVSALVVPYPTFTPTANNYTICQGASLVASATTTTNPTLYTYLWSSATPGLIFNPQLQNTTIQPPLLPVNVSSAIVVYSVMLSPTLNTACAVTQTLGITINNPLTPTLTMPQQKLCDISQPVQLIATPGGGTWSANPAVAPNGIFTPLAASIGTNSVLYSVSAGTCVVNNTASLVVSKFHTAALSSSISLRCVQDPVFNLMNIVQDTLTGRWSTASFNTPSISVVNNYFNAAGLASGNYSVQYTTRSVPDTAACPHSTILVIPVFNPPIPIIGNILPRCDNQGPFTLTANPNGGVWSGTGVSANGIQTPSTNINGVNSVSYSAGQGTCVAVSSKTFFVGHFNPATFIGTIPDLCHNSNPVNLMGIVQNTNGSWGVAGSNPPPSISLNNNFFNPIGLPTSVYTLSYTTHSTPTPVVCYDSKTLSISVLNPQIPTITQVGPFCSINAPLQLTVSPSNGHWVTSSFLNSAGVYSPALSPIGNSIVQYVIGTNTCNAMHTRTIQIESFVSATIIGQIPELCNTSLPVSLAPLTQNGSGVWTGAGVVGANFNPGIVGAGNFSITYNTASSPSGLCPDHSQLAVKVFSLASPVINKAGPYCNISAPVQLTVSPVGGIFDGGVPGTIDAGGKFNPAIASIGDNFLSYSISVGPCKANAQIKISVEKFVSATFEKLPDSIYCTNRAPFNLNSFVVNPGGRWSTSSAGFIEPNMFDPAQALPGAPIELTYETHSAINELLCPDKNSTRFWVKSPTPIKAQVNGPVEGCAPFITDFNTPSVNSGGIWNITDGTEYLGTQASHVFEHPGTYTIVFTYQDDAAAGCITQFTLNTPIVVHEAPKADFAVTPNEITLAEPEVTLTNLTSYLNENKYTWAVQGQLPSNSINHKIKFTQPGNFKITLTATNVFDCKNEISKQVEVKNDFQIQIPNSFTPNYDGLNDLFMPVFTSYGLDSKTFEMEIFDRWGHQVYRTKDVAKGWDGTIQGIEAKEGTYVYKIRYKDLDGRVYNTNGHLSLFR
ncbi:GEVED domain-containing protein [Aurantibacillus circumpalustris]|uniref:GEVED domain-containing protein n=1 Tax=Aurantibacillus circumpalustris TaxID=3036359 RepID=UPI00295C0018|nr:GEVED domain-containing protein [Aurantibacillus circumpalustris]